MKTTLLIDPFSGASGDMLLAALVDAGADAAGLIEQIKAIPALAEAKVSFETVARGAFAAKKMAVDLPHEHVHRGLSDVTAIIDAAPGLSDSVRGRACETFARLAMAEAKVHGTTVEEIHFHEVGALDAILDIVGFYVVAESLGIEEFVYTRLSLGAGSTKSAHGEIPIPAPATLELLAGHQVVFTGRDAELMTPTAAAIIAEMFRPLGTDETFVPGSMGYGAGTREGVGLPNVLRATVGRVEKSAPRVAIIRCTIDDMNPELYGAVMESLFEAGALEVYFQSVMMKKNRPGIELTVIAETTEARRIADHVLTHTTTIGVRIAHEERVELERCVETIPTPIGDAQVKVANLPGGGRKASPEYESCRALAQENELTVTHVFDIVRRAWQEHEDGR